MIACVALFFMFLGTLTDDDAPPVDTDDNNAQEAYADAVWRWYH